MEQEASSIYLYLFTRTLGDFRFSTCKKAAILTKVQNSESFRSFPCTWADYFSCALDLIPSSLSSRLLRKCTYHDDFESFRVPYTCPRQLLNCSKQVIVLFNAADISKMASAGRRKEWRIRGLWMPERPSNSPPARLSTWLLWIHPRSIVRVCIRGALDSPLKRAKNYRRADRFVEENWFWF